MSYAGRPHTENRLQQENKDGHGPDSGVEMLTDPTKSKQASKRQLEIEETSQARQPLENSHEEESVGLVQSPSLQRGGEVELSENLIESGQESHVLPTSLLIQEEHFDGNGSEDL
eukprot:gb/GEZN01023063.1/.p1 GENE.gb/GEZN01023063.1/~~gb/GEZN01023063.1/.p1  ORF type:complete len:115 (+),score=11.53 gb/GEZN01023063.1/:196-540(+)